MIPNQASFKASSMWWNFTFSFSLLARVKNSKIPSHLVCVVSCEAAFFRILFREKTPKRMLKNFPSKASCDLNVNVKLKFHCSCAIWSILFSLDSLALFFPLSSISTRKGKSSKIPPVGHYHAGKFPLTILSLSRKIYLWNFFPTPQHPQHQFTMWIV